MGFHDFCVFLVPCLQLTLAGIFIKHWIRKLFSQFVTHIIDFSHTIFAFAHIRAERFDLILRRALHFWFFCLFGIFVFLGRLVVA